MASVADLRHAIAQARLEVEEADRRRVILRGEINEANQRQQLRRELEIIISARDKKLSQNGGMGSYRERIDTDHAGDHMHTAISTDTFIAQATRKTENTSPHDGKVNITSSITKGEYIWRVQGMSWLENALMENGEETLWSNDFFVGTAKFDLVYAPTQGCIDFRDTQIGSLAIRHQDQMGIIFRYKLFIKKAGGDFVQWGPEANECHPDWEEMGKVFGPDVQKCPGEDSEPEQPIGIFGLTHEDLVKSEWVENDTLTVKAKVEVMSGSQPTTEALAPDVVVPPSTITQNILSMLEDGKYTDTTFVVEDRQIRAHSFILAARSEVFDRELNGCMQESLSKVVQITDADFATFDIFLRFLYTDDLKSVEAMIKSQVDLEKLQAAASGSGSTTCVANPRTVMLQNILSVSHRYQVQRLRLWCEQQLCEYICKDEVCSILCQAHLYDAVQLEKACLSFIKNNMVTVTATRGFGALSAEWPEVMLKINLFFAGLSEKGAAEALAAYEEKRKKRGAQTSVQEIDTGSAKHLRSE